MMNYNYYEKMVGMLVILMACARAGAGYTDADTVPLRAQENLPTNWLAELEAAIPAAPITQRSTFHEVTNFLCQESRRGNVTAQGYWGYIVLLQSHSPEETATGLRLLRASATNGFVTAMMYLGFVYQGGVFVPPDLPEAFHWFGEAAAKGSSEGILQLGDAITSAGGQKGTYPKQQSAIGERLNWPITRQ